MRSADLHSRLLALAFARSDFARLPGIEQARRLDAHDRTATAVLGATCGPRTSWWCQCGRPAFADHAADALACRFCGIRLVEVAGRVA